MRPNTVTVFVYFCIRPLKRPITTVTLFFHGLMMDIYNCNMASAAAASGNRTVNTL